MPFRRGRKFTSLCRSAFGPLSRVGSAVDQSVSVYQNSLAWISRGMAGCLTAAALTAWLAASGVQCGPIFRRVRKTKAAEPLSGQAVGHIVQRRAQLAGLEGDFAAHSLRSGFVTEAGRQNVPMKEAMSLTGHRSVATFLRYFQPGSLQTSAAANLLKEPADEGSP